MRSSCFGEGGEAIYPGSICMVAGASIFIHVFISVW